MILDDSKNGRRTPFGHPYLFEVGGGDVFEYLTLCWTFVWVSGNIVCVGASYNWNIKYTQTSLNRPTMGSILSGRFREVVDLQS